MPSFARPPIVVEFVGLDTRLALFALEAIIFIPQVLNLRLRRAQISGQIKSRSSSIASWLFQMVCPEGIIHKICPKSRSAGRSRPTLDH